MPSLAVLRVLFRELTTSERAPRITEPDLVMDDPEKVAAYTRAGLEDGVMAPVYLFHCAQICEVIRPGDQVLDLACGPANQLAQVARINPETQFVGVDLSVPMLERARALVKQKALTNVDFHLGSITDLSHFPDTSIDAVISTMALHHLPDQAMLQQVFKEVARVIKPGGGIYMVDFGHLRSEASINYFAYQYADRQPELFTLDYLYSLRAAFSLNDFRHAIEPIRQYAQMYSTFLAPYMVAIKSKSRRDVDAGLAMTLKEMKNKLPAYHKIDFKDLRSFFRFGGLHSRAL